MAANDDFSFENIEEEAFMDKVREFPAIYDTSQAIYKNRTIKKNAWQEIAREFSTSVESVQLKYKTIRTRIGRYLRTVRPSGSGTADFTTDATYEPFKWLFGYIKHRATASTSLPGAANNVEVLLDSQSQDQSDLDGEDDQGRIDTDSEPSKSGTCRV